MNQTFSLHERNFVTNSKFFFSDTTLSIPETLYLTSTSSITFQTPSITFTAHFTSQLNDRYRELQSTTSSLRLDWNSSVEPPSF